MKMLEKDGTISSELRTIIENTNDLVFVKNKDFVYIASSKAYANNCSQCNSVENIIGKTDFELFKDQTIAMKYRKDDETLFASGKPMLEFEEDILDENGKKHTCLIHKYLLRDEEGNPIAIFGQYHDIGKQVETEIARRIDMNDKITKAINSMFYASYFIDLENKSFSILKGTDYAKKIFKNCKSIDEVYDLFIKKFVIPDDQLKVSEFCNLDTIAERLSDKTHIDCEYREVYTDGWCQSCFLPVAYDENKKLTHVLFVLSIVDKKRAKNIDEAVSSKKDLEGLFEAFPSGIVIYEWDGKKLTFLKTNMRYREWFEYDTLKDGDVPTYSPFHPDDLKGYQEAIKKALTETHHLEYSFRILDKKEKHYKWIQINAVAKLQANGKYLVYAIFTDISEQKEAHLEIEKKQASLEAALNASNQLCCEYDPVLHTAKCLTEKNFFGVATFMPNYPECLRTITLIHPEDLELFIKTVHTTDDGKHNAHCDIRGMCDGVYRWYSCRFSPYYDVEKERSIVFLTIVDATMRVESIERYKKSISAIEKSNEDALCMCEVNITKNEFYDVQADGRIKYYSESTNSLDEFIKISSNAVINKDEKKEYLTLFNCKSLLKRFDSGESHIRLDHFYRIDEKNTMIVATIFDLIKEPISGDVVGIAYAKDLSKIKMSNILLNAALKKDYPVAALIYVDTGEYYLYDVERKEYCVHKHDFWSAITTRLFNVVDKEEFELIKKNFLVEKIMNILKSNNEYSYPFYGWYNGKRCRLEATFRYADDFHQLLIATLRNITDEQLYRKYKHDSEHDALTGLYNRKTVFEKSRALLNEHPDEEFTILHLDIRRFHLYNTFFGDKEGDKLLCEMSNQLLLMAKEYDSIVCGRMEADVFCVFFPTNRGLFEGHVRRCFAKLEQFSPNFPIELVIGAYVVKDPTMSMEAMFTRATIAAKSYANNLFGLISLYDDSMEQNLLNNQQIISEMTPAIEQEQFKVYLQPKYSLRSEKMVGAEALVRWKHPKRGLISPGIFIPIFEKNGFIANLDRYMWEHVCKILRKWKEEGKPMYPISVNVSRVSMYNHLIVPFLKSLVEKYQIDPKYLELELTESTYIDDPEDLKKMLKELQQYGFKILIDDFGSGYSSLNALRDLPVDVLKLDMKFLPLKHNDVRGNAVLSSVVRMSKLLNLPIVAEGVETQEQADFLRSVGCEYVQGYLYAKPMPVKEYEELLKDKKEIETTNTEPNSLAEADIVLENSFIPHCLLEYNNGYFAFLRTNKEFLKQFGLVDNLNPASKEFYNHLSKKNYTDMLQAFETCSKTREDLCCKLIWKNNNIEKYYYAYIKYHGRLGKYAILSLAFMNVTSICNFDEKRGKQEKEDPLSIQIESSFETAFINLELNIKDIVEIVKLVRKQLNLDKIILYSNKEYMFQLSHVFTCTEEGVEYHKSIYYHLSKNEYHNIINRYKENEVMENPTPTFKDISSGFFLNTALIRENECFGTITFWSKDKRVWNENDKKMLLKLKRLCLMFFAMNNLIHGTNSYIKAVDEFQNPHVLAGFYVNMKTKEFQTIKIPEGMKKTIPEWGEYDALLNFYAENYVEGFYKNQLIDNCKYSEINRKLNRDNPSFKTEFPRVYNGNLDWVCFKITGYNFQENGLPSIAMASFNDITEDVKNNAYLFGANNTTKKMYTTIVALNLDTEQYAVCVDDLRKKDNPVKLNYYGHYSEIRKTILQRTSRKEQEGPLLNYFNQKYLIKYFDSNDDMLQCEFSSLVEKKPLWLRFMIVKSSDYSTNNRKVMLYFNDITDMKNKQILLEKEKEQKQYLSEHDSLTGAYNRRGYERILEKYKYDHHPMAFIQLDIDNFKKINDTYGHAFGDEVLKQITIQLKAAFRANDYVFRFGGDEFAVLLTNCNIDIRHSIGYKQGLIHIRLNQILKKKAYVTISMGVSLSNSGYNDELIALADAALYKTKSNGRAGCCIFDSNHKLVYEWKDDIRNNVEGSPLDQSDTGACRMELPGGDLSKGKLFCNETARILMGLDTNMSPEECFKTWLNRIDSSSRETITKTRKAMIEKGQAECTYIYNHPIQGKVIVRSGGRCIRNDNGVVLYGYHQLLQNTQIVFQENDTQKLIESMMNLYFVSYYIDLKDDWYWDLRSMSDLKQSDKQDNHASTVIQNLAQRLVNDNYKEKMIEFVNLKTLPTRLKDKDFVETEYESVDETIGRCRARFLAVKRDEKGIVTHVQLLVASINKEKQK